MLIEVYNTTNTKNDSFFSKKEGKRREELCFSKQVRCARKEAKTFTPLPSSTKDWFLSLISKHFKLIGNWVKNGIPWMLLYVSLPKSNNFVGYPLFCWTYRIAKGERNCKFWWFLSHNQVIHSLGSFPLARNEWKWLTYHENWFSLLDILFW